MNRDDKPDYPDWICAECAHRECNGMPEGHIATFHNGVCDLCGERKHVTEPRDYRGFKTPYKFRFLG